MSDCWSVAAFRAMPRLGKRIVERYHPRIYNVCYRFAGDSYNAQDLTQEVFIKMYRTLNTYDSGKGAFMTWVTAITRNLLVDHEFQCMWTPSLRLR